jgi:putative ABC transport system permease protein
MGWLKLPKRKHLLEQEFDRELRFHIEELTRKNLEAGMQPAEARRKAMLEFGGKEQATEGLREVHQIPVVETLWTNLRFAWRLMRKSPVFSGAIILTLALGIGANSAVFSAIDAVLLRPLPFPHGDELMLLQQYNAKEKSPPTFVAPTRLEDWNAMNSTFQSISGYYQEDGSETSGELPEKVTHVFVASRFLQVLGVAPALGRDFAPQEEHYGGPTVVLISDRYWRQKFGASPDVVGKAVHFGNGIAGHRPSSWTIVGVMPPSFAFPNRDVDLWSPSPADAPFAKDRSSTWYTAIGRLKPGVDFQKARADIANVQARLGMQFPKTDGNLAVRLLPLKDHTVDNSRRSLWILFGSVTLLLLIACTNIAALLLARMREREHEIAVRFSLGASRRIVIEQLLTEVFALALIGSLAGLALAAGAAKLFRTFTPNLPRVEEITLDWTIVSYSLACALSVTFLCGMLPALRATRDGLSGTLAKNSGTQVSGRTPVQWILAGVQVALAVTLLIGAGLLQRSLSELARVSPGFDPAHVLTLHISASWGETADMKNMAQRSNRILDTLRAVPGVKAAALTSTLPGISNQQETEFRIIEGEQDPNRKIVADIRFVSTGYFDTLHIPLLAGEPCQDVHSAMTAVVNRSFAATYFGQSPAIGHHVATTDSSQYPITGEIRGIVGDAREQGLNTEPVPTVYWCSNLAFPGTHYLVRTQGEPQEFVNTLRRTIHQIEPSRSVFDLQPLQERLEGSFAEDRLRTTLLSLFAITAVSLACLGLYGTLSYFVSLRRREIGLRLALGALRQQIGARFLAQGLRVSVIGCAAGLALAAASVRLLSGMLYGVSAFDPITFTGVVGIVMVVASLATVLPAIRAARTDPMRVLRDE